MQDFTHLLFTELCTRVAELGKDGGLISPSVYDTAQVIRFALAPDAAEPALQWLLKQQRADGGWGDPTVPYARQVPTLAAVLALHHINQQVRRQSKGQAQRQHSIDAGLAFLCQEAGIWATLVLDGLPIAAEMILPRLLEQAIAAGLSINLSPYTNLFALRERKCQQILKFKPVAGAAPTYSWEAWGRTPHAPLFDQSGGIGHSPSATAVWLQQSAAIPELATARAQAHAYLERAAAATQTGIPGVVPNVYPIIGFEICYGIYALMITGLFDHPALQAPIAAKLQQQFEITHRGWGVSFGHYFVPDVDESSLALAALSRSGYQVDLDTVMQFKSGDHFYTFQHELNPSVFSNAHALYGLAEIKQREPTVEEFLIARQQPAGIWLADKWHSSWIYTTLEVTIALQRLGYQAEVRHALDAVLATQQQAGHWGSGQQGSVAETGHMLILLQTLANAGQLPDAGYTAMAHGHTWLMQQFQPNQFTQESLWLGKELYTPYRVDRIYELSGLLALQMAAVGV